jgi:hypothetical protein
MHKPQAATSLYTTSSSAAVAVLRDDIIDGVVDKRVGQV